MLGGRSAVRALELPAPADLALAVGDVVTLHMQPERLLQASLWAYGLPLFAMLLGPLLGEWLWGPLSDGQLALAALASMTLAFTVVRRLVLSSPCAGRLVPSISGLKPVVT